MCRDGSATHAEAVCRALPDAVQVSDRWHLWRNLCDKARLEVRAHAGCWATINPPRPGGVREQTTRERWNKIHDLLGRGVGLLDCSRRLGLALNTVKRYARMPEPQTLRLTPAYRPTLVDPYREHLRRRRAEEPAVPPGGDPGAGLHRQRKPPGPLPQPGPCRRRPPRHHGASRRPPPAHRPRESAPEGNGPAGEDRRSLPGDDRTRRSHTRLRRSAETSRGQRHETHRVDHGRPRRHPASPVQSRQRARNRPARRERRPHLALPQWPHRRRQHPHQEDHETDTRTRRIRPPPAPHPPVLAATRCHHRLRARAKRFDRP